MNKLTEIITKSNVAFSNNLDTNEIQELVYEIQQGFETESLNNALAVLKMVRSNYRRFGKDSSKRMICRLEPEEVELIEKVLKN
jgi:hypothetical protein|tara:strand:+ start:315 stop:566 length:252 start_codon:yes stop_codon:yes gene_type:complete